MTKKNSIMKNIDVIVASLKDLKNLKQEDFEYTLPTIKSIDNSVFFIELVEHYLTDRYNVPQHPTKIQPDGEGGISFIWSSYPVSLLVITIFDDYLYLGYKDEDNQRFGGEYYICEHPSWEHLQRPMNLIPSVSLM